jgi:hypothetical protein
LAAAQSREAPAANIDTSITTFGIAIIVSFR